MKAIEFPEVTQILGENQPEYENLPVCIKSNSEDSNFCFVTSCFELSDAELAYLLKERKIWLSVFQRKDVNFNPVLLNVVKPDEIMGLSEPVLTPEARECAAKMEEILNGKEPATRKRYKDFTEEEQSVIRKNTCETMAHGTTWKFATDTDNTKWSFESNNPIISVKSMQVHRKLEREFYTFFRKHTEIL